MSTGLMSCVRENSPPLEMAGGDSGALSLPTNGTEPQKRRRFHPLRNLRRIFRRRTLTSVDTATSVSSPSSLSSQSQLSSAPTVIASVPAHNISPSYCKSSTPADVTVMSSTAYSPHLIGLSGNRGVGSCGVAIIPTFSSSVSASGGFHMKESSREHTENTLKSKEASTNDLKESREMTDCQRSFSEGRLVDSDFSRDGLSQSHDSVFSESATASSLSIVLKAELFDALRKRRNRPDASDEDLGLPRSPTTPQRKDQSAVNQSEVSSLSLLSMASSDLDDELSSNYGIGEKTVSSVSSSKMSSLHESSKTSDEIDFVISSGSRLSHSAARHKMAVRPKKKGPTRLRRPVESTLLPSTPEVNEEFLKIPLEGKDIMEKGKSHSLPPGVNAKILEQHSHDMPSKDITSHIKRSKTEKVTSPTGARSVRDISKCNIVDNELVGSASHDKREDEAGFFRRLLQRNSKKSKKSIDECDKLESNLDANSNGVDWSKTCEKTEEYTHKVEETRKEIRKEILSEAKSSLSAMLNTFILSPDHETEPDLVQKVHKPKSGPASRQRVMPKDLTSSPLPDPKIEKKVCAQFIEHESVVHAPVPAKTSFDTSKGVRETLTVSEEGTAASQVKGTDASKIGEKLRMTNEELLGPRLVKSYTEETHKSTSTARETTTISEHFEKKERIQPKIVGLSPFLQKVSRSETLTLDSSRPIPKQRKSVEKSKSFRYYSEGDSEAESTLKKHENMPSLPDLTFSKKIYENSETRESLNKLPMAFEINDNNLIKLRRNEEPLPLSQGIYTKNIILTTSKPSSVSMSVTTPITSPCCNQNITEIEENIDKLVKSPFVTVLKKSSNIGETVETKNVSKVCTTTTMRKGDTFEMEEDKIEIETARNTVTSETKKTSEIVECKEKISSVEHYEQKLQETSNSICNTTTTKVEMRNKDIPKVASLPKTRRSSSVLEMSGNNQVPEFMKITLNRVDSTRPKSNIVLSKNVKPESEDKDAARRYSNESVEITDNKPPIPPDNTLKRNSIPSNTKTQDDVTIKSPTKKVDEENNILRNSENTQTSQALYERRKSVTDEKLKYEKKIEELKSDKKKAVEENRVDPRRTSIDEETGVILRKKSFTLMNQSSKKDDTTPELMKVFARRSLKIKDDELQSSFEEIEKSNTLKKFTNLDSDKENQSSSEEKLDKLPKVEITIQSKQVNHNSGLNQKTEEKTRSLSEFRKPNSSVTSTPTKSYAPPIRYSNIVGYRTVSTIYGKTTTQSTTSSIEQSSTSNTNEQNNNNNNNNNTSTNNNKKGVGIRHTIGGSTNQAAIIDQTEESEFKGILQRRAEWEKRAKEALK